MKKSILIVLVFLFFASIVVAGQKVFVDPITGEVKSSPSTTKEDLGLDTDDDVKFGSLSAGISIHTTISTNTTLEADDINGGIIPLSGDGTTVVMPAVSSALIGKFVSFYVTDATAKHVDVNASDKTTLRGTDLDDGDKLSCVADSAGSMLTLYCIDLTGWIAPSGSPFAWTDGG